MFKYGNQSSEDWQKNVMIVLHLLVKTVSFFIPKLYCNLWKHHSKNQNPKEVIKNLALCSCGSIDSTFWRDYYRYA